MKTKIISAVLVLLMLVSAFASCTPTTPPAETTSPETSTPVSDPVVTDPPTQEETQPITPSSVLDLIKDGTSSFTVLRPVSADDTVMEYLLEFISEFQNYTNVRLNMTYEGKNDQPQNDNYEILIGETNRAETLQVSEQLKYDDYFYGVVGNKIVILGGNPKATSLAMLDFLTYVVKKAAITDQNNITLDPENNYTYNKTYVLSSLSVAGVDAKSYKIVYSESDYYGAYLAAKRLSLLIANVTGYRIPVVDDSVQESEYEIVVGDTNRTNLNKSTSAYTIAVSGKKLYLHSPKSAPYKFLYEDIETMINAAKNSFDFATTLSQSTALSSVLNRGSENMLKREGSIRVIFNNIWDLSVDDPTAPMKLRAQQLADVYRDYAPDVLGLQEASGNVEKYLWAKMKTLGYLKAPCPATNYNSSEFHNSNVIYYNPEKVKLITSGAWLLKEGINDGIYNIPGESMRIAPFAIFEDKATGKQFCIVSIHYTWLKNSDDAKQSRIFDAQGTIALIEHLSQNFDVPIILGGDYNTSKSSQPIKMLTDAGLVDIETISKKTENQHTTHPYPVFDDNGICIKYSLPVGNQGSAIDHILAYNAKNVTFNLYDVVVDWFALASTDHCPLLTDLTLS